MVIRLTSTRARAARNAAVGAATAIGAGLLFLYPTSTAGGLRKPIATAPAGAVPATSGEPLRINGPAVQTVYGPVQVQIVVLAGTIRRATAIVFPQVSVVDVVINERAIPLLEADARAKQSGAVDTISGATQTSEGYRASLQAALDAANF